MNGDVIALLPDSLCFKVCQENSSKNDEKEEQAEIPRNEMTDDLPSISPVTDVNDEEKPLKPSKIPTGTVQVREAVLVCSLYMEECVCWGEGVTSGLNEGRNVVVEIFPWFDFYFSFI